ncbi:MAG: MnhB domain-containing protein [Pseudolabrys sp.]
MTYEFGFEIGLAALLLAIAVCTIVVRAAFAAIVLFMIYGLLAAIAWVRLFAVDVALTEAAIGGGLTGMLMLAAAARLRESEGSGEKLGLPTRLAAVMLCTLISFGLGIVVLSLPDAGPTLAPMAKANLAQTGLGNPVTAVLFAYRAFDTLLEKVVLLLALVGVWSLAPDRMWGGVPGVRVYAQPSSILVFLAQLLPPIGIMIGIYMFWTGANHPGGAFQGGTILAAMWLLVMIARLQPVPAISLRPLRLLLVTGPLIFIVIGLFGFVFADAFLAYPEGYSKALIIIAEATLTLSIGVTLGLLVAGPPEWKTQQ